MSIALTCLFVGQSVTTKAETDAARESVKSLHVAFAPMEPVFQTAPALPTSRPDPALAYLAIPVSIIPPVSGWLKNLWLMRIWIFEKILWLFND